MISRVYSIEMGDESKLIGRSEGYLHVNKQQERESREKQIQVNIRPSGLNWQSTTFECSNWDGTIRFVHVSFILQS